MPWSRKEKYFASLLNFNNYSKAKRQIYRWVYKFQAKESVNKLNKKAENPRSVRKLTARCPENVDAVRDSVGRSPKKSLRRCSEELGLSCASLQRILKKDLLLYQYRIQIKHKLTPADIEKHFVICWWFENKIKEDPDFLDEVWFSDEESFWICGHINSNN